MSWPDLHKPDQLRSLPVRLGWMAIIWVLSVAALGLLATVIGWAIK